MSLIIGSGATSSGEGVKEKCVRRSKESRVEMMMEEEEGGSAPEEMMSNKSRRRGESSSLSSSLSSSDIPSSSIPFNRITINTDLSPAPKNWMRSLPRFHGLNPLLNSSGSFSSFGMTAAFPNTIGYVDVISDSENIKNLLKIPYNPRKPLSMVVHRIGSTLLIDDFDIHRYLINSSEADWVWLRKVISETIFSEKPSPNKIAATNKIKKSKEIIHEKSLVSKFLYRSLPEETQIENYSNNNGVTLKNEEGADPINKTKDESNQLPEEPSIDQALPQVKLHNRNLIWNFEDIRMLIGSDMPIFGDADHPSVSLRLHNMKHPINILTGLDYWLDNLMCQVPEVLMCYHLDNIVQRYELHQTEDLPNLGGVDNKFNPRVVRDVAQNILSFLRSNATKEGHTYWLFKPKDDDVVKLYDLTSLCDGYNDEKEEKDNNNPFQTAVSMLLYKVARSVVTSDERKNESETIKRLLTNCLSLLDTNEYPQIASSAHYMLSELYIPEDLNPANPEFSTRSSKELNEFHADHEKETEPCNIVDIKSLCQSSSTLRGKVGDNKQAIVKSQQRNSSALLINDNVFERCKFSLKHVVQGLEFLSVLVNRRAQEKEYEDKKREAHERDNPKMSKPNEPIPMPYTSNDKKETSMKNNELIVKESKGTKSQSNVSWHGHLKLVLLKKAFLIYITMAEAYHAKSQYGDVLKSVKKSLEIFKVIKYLVQDSSKVNRKYILSFALGVAGDSYVAMVKNWSQIVSYIEAFNNFDETTNNLKEKLENFEYDFDESYFQDDDEDWIKLKFPSDIEESMLLGAKCFNMASKFCTDDNSYCVSNMDRKNLLMRLGNVNNEIGVFYMNRIAGGGTESKDDDSSITQELLEKSAYHLNAGIENFKDVKDDTNIALLYSNSGRLSRVKAHVSVPDHENRSEELTEYELEQYYKAIDFYSDALKILGNRRNSPAIWDSISWELSSTLFLFGTLLQDFAPLSKMTKKEVEQKITDYYMKALKYCDIETPGPKLDVYQYRVGLIHHRLASMYHHNYRNMNQEEAHGLQRKNHLKQLADIHYIKASKLFDLLELGIENLRVQLERAGLIEFALIDNNLKGLKSILDILGNCHTVIKCLGNKEDVEVSERDNLIQLLLQRLQTNLLLVIKSLVSSKKAKKNNLIAKFKSIYAESLKIQNKYNQPEFINELTKLLNLVQLECQKLG